MTGIEPSAIRCNRCKKIKPTAEFKSAGRRGRGPSGRFLWCLRCRGTDLALMNVIKAERRTQKNTLLSKMNRSDLKKVERLRQRATEVTGTTHHLEHIVPLRGFRSKRPVCGLHVCWNIALASEALNLSKSNHFTDRDAERVERGHMLWLQSRGLSKGQEISIQN
jgi:hypothetical protein